MRADFVELRHLNETKEEVWSIKRKTDPHYSAFADFSLRGLGKGPGKCLVIGSPLFEAVELKQAGWDVTYLDVRRIPWRYRMIFRFIQTDASEGCFPDQFEVVSCTCVLCHAGLGRYGDPKVEDADVKIMQNIYKSLKKGGKASVTVGCVADVAETTEVGTAWRVWNLEGARALMKDFKILDEKLYCGETGKWKEGKPSTVLNQDYLCFLLQKT